MRRLVGGAALVAAALVLLLTGLVLQPTTAPASQGGQALAMLAAYNSKEGQGDVLGCGPAGPAGAGAKVAAAAAARAGFKGEALVVAVAVAGAESGWNPGATNSNTNGSTDYGMWQINSVHATLLASGDWRDPYQNAAMAKRVYDDALGWGPWVAYTSGAYAKHLPAARGAVAGADTAVQPCTGTGGPQGGNDRLTPWTRAMRADVSGAFPDLVVGCYRAAEDGGEHPRGRACDFMVTGERGDQVAAYAQQHHARLHIMYLIWEQHIWSPERADEGWRPMEDRGSPTQNHMDHVHVSVRP